MLDYIINLNLEKSINKDELLDLFITKSSDINSILLSKIEPHSKISDFFSQYTNLDLNSIYNSINIINNQFSNTSSKHLDGELETYINILSTIILTIHYGHKLKMIFFNKIKELQQNLIEDILNNKVEDPYKDKILEYNSLSYSILGTISKDKICFSKLMNNKPKIFNHFDSKGQNYFNNNKEPTPKFFISDNEPKSPFNKDFNKKENENQIEEFKKETSQGKSSKNVSKSSLSMSSILVINQNHKGKKKSKKKESPKKIKRFYSLENNKIKLKMKDINERKIESNKILSDNQVKKEGNKKSTFFALTNKKSANSDMYKEANNSGKKELFAELIKFANELYKDNYIDENQKIVLKQLIIKYITFKR